ncbi:MAG: beta-ketoacyl-ACP synthase II [Myxococcales bacterium]|nr:beta-ketoacyl-ACP synthase II [Myxococcales bacterium]
MERVVITGIGFVIPNGIGTIEPFRHVLSGKSAIGPITHFDTTEYASKVAGEVRDFAVEPYLADKRKARELDRFSAMSIAATHIAFGDAALELTEEERDTTGTIIGVGLGGLQAIENSHNTLRDKGPKRVTPYFIPQTIANLAAGQVSILHRLRGPSFCTTSACSSSAHAIGEAAGWIRRGAADVMIAGGAEAAITHLGVGGFCAMMALSKRNDSTASRPWDKGRDGFVIGEGAVTLVLESLTRARKRGARIYAELTGYGASSDAHHITQPAPEGEGAARAMRLALRDAKLDPSAVGYINAHGTSTPQGDIQEALAIRHVFGDHATSGKLAISSTKSTMGHLLGSAGAVEAAIAAMTISEGIIPPTLHLDDPDPAVAGLDLVPHTARERRVDHVLSNSFGFGGTNATLVISRVS